MLRWLVAVAIMLGGIAVTASSKESQSKVLELNNADFDNELKLRNPPKLALIHFYMPYSGHCKQLKARFDQVADHLLEKNIPATLARVDCERNKDVCDRFDLQGYPSIKLFRNGRDSMDYSGIREVDSLVRLMEEHHLFENEWLHSWQLGALANHWAQAILSAFGWFLLMRHWHGVASLVPWLGDRIRQLDHRQRRQWAIYVVAFVHAAVIVSMASGVLSDAHLKENRVFGYSTWAGTTYAVTVGYFIWDLFVCLRYFGEFGPAFLLHALLCLTAYILSFRPLLQYHGAVFLMFEVSTLFLNIHWFLDKLGLTGSIYQLVNGVLLVGAYIFVRIGWGWYMSYCFFVDFFANWEEIPVFPRWFYPIANVALNSLNVIWLYKILDALARRFRPQPPAKKD